MGQTSKTSHLASVKTESIVNGYPEFVAGVLFTVCSLCSFNNQEMETGRWEYMRKVVENVGLLRMKEREAFGIYQL